MGCHIRWGGEGVCVCVFSVIVKVCWLIETKFGPTAHGKTPEHGYNPMQNTERDPPLTRTWG